MVRRLVFATLALLLLIGLLACQKPFAKPVARTENRLTQPITPDTEVAARVPVNLPFSLPIDKPSIVVKKRQRQLLLFSADKLVRTYRIGLGLSPVGDKVRAGDRRTPEGRFYIFTKNPQSAFYLSLGVSYPNEEHAQRGLRDGLITRAQHARILEALKRKSTPPQNTALGGTIYIHGRGAQSDWTWGCVALDDPDIRELYKAVEVRTPVIIEP